MTKSLFLTGVTGYFGGDVFVHLLENYSNEYTITVMVRSEVAAKTIQDLGKGVKTVVGTYERSEILKI